MEKFEFIEYYYEDTTAFLILNRPEVHNAFNSELISELIAAFYDIQKKQETRLILIKGNGPSFSSGADLNYMKRSGSLSYEKNFNDAKRLAELFNIIYMADPPVAVFAHGHIAGGANGILAAADFVAAAEGTVFRFSEVLLGLIPATIAPYVLRKIGPARSSELLLTGRAFSAVEAKDFSLVNEVVPFEEMDKAQKSFIQQMNKVAPEAVKKTKNLLREIENVSINQTLLDKTSALIAGARASDEGREGLNAFFDKRKPNWFIKID